MSIGWKICINMVIGIPVFFAIIIGLLIFCYIKFGGKVCSEMMEDTIRRSEDTYAFMQHPQLMKVMSAVLTFALWEIFITMICTEVYNECKSLYELRGGKS